VGCGGFGKVKKFDREMKRIGRRIIMEENEKGLI
jgi:hypothetical protein